MELQMTTAERADEAGRLGGRNIVVFSDGTGQEGGVRPDQRMSNIYKLFRAAKVSPDTSIDPARQIVFYDPGLGTDADARGFTSLRRAIVKLLSALTGRGITINIADCYEFIINHYRPGDRIYLFGFSRGAYTIRCVANVLRLCGVPTKSIGGPLPRFRNLAREIAEEAVVRVYEHGAGHPRERFETEREEMARRFQKKYASEKVAPYFIGAFDTVASLGAKGPLRILLALIVLIGIVGISGFLGTALHFVTGWDLFWSCAVGAVLIGLYAGYRYLRTAVKVIARSPVGGWFSKNAFSMHVAQWSGRNFDRLLSPDVEFARHAISIDENRADFPRLGWGHSKHLRQQVEGEPEPFVQLWFAGNHSDIGGSYPEVESRLSDNALRWMVDEASSLPHPLQLDMRRLHLFPAADGLQHDEVASMTDSIRRRTPFFLRWLTGGMTWKQAIRDPMENSPVHPSVVERFAMEQVEHLGGRGPYRPEALKKHEQFLHLYTHES